MGEQSADNLKREKVVMATERQDNDNRQRESGLRRDEPRISGDEGTRGGRGERRATDQVETGQGCTPAGEEKETACLVRQALSPSGRPVVDISHPRVICALQGFASY